MLKIGIYVIWLLEYICEIFKFNKVFDLYMCVIGLINIYLVFLKCFINLNDILVIKFK